MNKNRVADFIVSGIAIALLVLAWVGSHHHQATAVPTQTSSRTHTWVKADSLAYARDKLEVFTEKQFACLSNLWGKESAWEPKAKAKVKSMGMYAGGIPQLLGMSPSVRPTSQIDRGLAYIYYRYTTPCKAWSHWQRKGWY